MGIDDFPDVSFRRDFGFEKGYVLELLDLFTELWGLPRVYRTNSRSKFTQLEAFLIWSRRMRGALSDFHEIGKAHCCSPSAANEVFGAMNADLHDIGLDMMQDLTLFEDYASDWAAACKAKGVSSNLNVIGFIDGKVHEMCRNGGFDQQRLTYNGNHGFNGFSYMHCWAPCGLSIFTSGAVEGRRHDSYVLRVSGMPESLRSLHTLTGTLYSVYGDAAFALTQYVLVGYKRSAGRTAAQREFTSKMNALRTSAEWGFAIVLNTYRWLWKWVDKSVWRGPIQHSWISATLITNCRCCLYGNQITSFFDCKPPTLRTYLELSTRIT